ncbi:DUF6572 domain-containing protein [Sedimenticola thiotaurini]|uniref:DUF6572 domain-containing protein n=1 Tax=Sedimenticola thiotaurini TaxID=1543721 RepID=UPI0009E3B8CB|nr:DUF6572 domain-containing protein [Sedimenticola thiotaurini]
MSIEDQSTIDAIGIASDELAVLTISDHLEWDNDHLYKLQEKINVYLAFIESGEIYESYPQAKGKSIKINVVCKHEPSVEAAIFLTQCTIAINEAGFQFGHEVHI